MSTSNNNVVPVSQLCGSDDIAGLSILRERLHFDINRNLASGVDICDEGLAVQPRDVGGGDIGSLWPAGAS